jgi:hypothetical protein
MEYVGEKYRINMQQFTEPDEAWQWLAQQGTADGK